MKGILYLVIAITGTTASPVDEPIRIDLPVYDQPRSSSNVLLAEPLLPENNPGDRTKDDKSTNGNLILNSEGTVVRIFSHKSNSEYPAVGSVNNGGIFSPPITKLEGALLETEDIGSKTLSIKENVQNVVAGVFQPKPIVDTIKEEEKYGNDGDKFRDAGKAIVGGAEGISNFINSILEIPSNFIRSIARSASEKLNSIGGKLVGL